MRVPEKHIVLRVILLLAENNGGSRNFSGFATVAERILERLVFFYPAVK
jgi:hypothetical protein